MSTRETVPTDVYAGIDFDAFNEGAERYRAITRGFGFSAALSAYVGEPVVVVGLGTEVLGDD